MQAYNHSAGKAATSMGGALQLLLPRTRQLKKALHSLFLTVVCGFTTILVLKGTAGFTPNVDVGYGTPPPAVSSIGSSSSITLRSELQQARLLSELHNLIHLQSQQQQQIPRQHEPLPVSESSDQSPTLNRESLTSGIPLANYRLNPSAKLNGPLNLRANHNHRDFQITRFLIQNPAPSTYQKSSYSSDSPPTTVDPSSSTQNPSLHRELNPPLINPSPSLTGNPSLNRGLNPTSINPIPASTRTKSDINQNHKQNNEASTRTLEASSQQKPSILLVTGSQPFACENPIGDHYLMKSLKNKLDYCRLHNIEIFYNMANFDPQMSGFWAKLPLIQKLMVAHPEKEWIWWIDSDAIITDMAFELPMDRYKDYNFILHGWKELVYDQKNWIGLNTGSFLIRNCQWSLDLLREWAPMGIKGKVREEAGKLLSSSLVGRPAFEADDQSALIYLLNEKKSKWASKVYLENSYYLHGYWLIIVDRYEQMMEKYHPGLGDERWPFVTHFVGCKPCGNKRLTLDDKCLEHMERAFNFADNQVLQHYGVQHEALNTYRVTNTSPN